MDQNDPLASAMRSILIAAGSSLITKGYFDAATWQMVAGTIIAVGISIWGYMSKSKAAMIASVNTADNGVKVVPLSSPTPAVNEPVELHPVKT